MTKTFQLPDLGEGLHEAEIQEVLVSIDDQVEEGQEILVVETDKAAVEIPSPYTGKIAGINVEAGDIISVGDPVVEFEVEGEEQADSDQKTGNGKAARSEEREEREDPQPSSEEETSEEPEQVEREGDLPVPASPATRRLARELDVDLSKVPASGEHGQVTSEDVREFAEKGKPEERQKDEEEKKKSSDRRQKEEIQVRAVELPDFSKWGEVKRKKLRSVRRTIANKMAQSWAQIPHVSHRDLADITVLNRIRLKQKQDLDLKSLSLTVFIMKAAVAALKEFPRFNASLDAGSEEIILKNYYHIGVAVDTDRGLIVPVIRDVNQKSIVELSDELNEIAQMTRDGEIELDQLQGGTFTITNVGVLGGEDFTPIINYPQAAILGAARASWRPVVIKQGQGSGEVEPRYLLPLILTFDHRIVDGADAARFMNSVVEILEDPKELLLKV